jgi:hypothetical protein
LEQVVAVALVVILVTAEAHQLHLALQVITALAAVVDQEILQLVMDLV